MSVHLFGNTCSPAIATYGLRKTADDGEEKFGKAEKEYVCNDFYVDFLLSRPPRVGVKFQPKKHRYENC